MLLIVGSLRNGLYACVHGYALIAKLEVAVLHPGQGRTQYSWKGEAQYTSKNSASGGMRCGKYFFQGGLIPHSLSLKHNFIINFMIFVNTFCHAKSLE